ncbi:MAG TPA: ATP-binding cassette domain-containing protein, partial [Spirochaetales bacterium]|nr:ATP-binding cassette domain-containing protein [Spirochaetales bacterium]
MNDKFLNFFSKVKKIISHTDGDGQNINYNEVLTDPQNARNDEQYDTHPPHALTDNEEHVLECRNLVKRFGRKVAVRGVNIAMKTSQITGLLGPNGAGKTTIFYMIVGFIQPNGGGVYLDHHLLSELPMHKRALLGIAYLP